MKMDVQTLEAKKSGSVTLDDGVFGLEPRKDILHRMVRYQLAKRQAGTHHVQERGEVKKTTKRIGNQKGGGTARHGNGSVGLRHALSAKVASKELIIIDEAALKAPKTSELQKLFTKLGVVNGLVVSGASVDENFAKAARNIPNVELPRRQLSWQRIIRLFLKWLLRLQNLRSKKRLKSFSTCR